MLKKISAIKALCAFLLWAFSIHANAEWTYIAQNNYGKYYVDLSTVEFEGDIIKVWEYTDYRFFINKTYHSAKIYMEYDCKNALSRGVEYMFYSGRDLAGDVVKNETLDNEEWQPAAEGTVSAEILKAVCSQEANNDEKLFDSEN